LLGTLAPIVGDPRPPLAAASPEPSIAALDLAAALRQRASGLQVLDVRRRGAYDQGHVPTARWVRPADLATTLASASSSVVVTASDAEAEAALSSLSEAERSRVRVLAGGFDAWLDEVKFPALDPALGATERARRETLSRYFGGTPRLASPAELAARAAAGAASETSRPRLAGRGC
jgi:rhodanese-related sulfurtransferase